MKKSLITVLGRASKGENGYRTTRYDFGDGAATEPAAFFGWTLHERIRPDRVVILGTAGSMWDHLFEGDKDLGAEGEVDRLELIEKVSAARVEQSLLSRLEPLLAGTLQCAVSLHIIPHCREPEEHWAIIRTLADVIQPDDEIGIDITHGFRHLPLMALVAARYLSRIRRARIVEIYYGAFEMTVNGVTPVLRLSGLLRMLEWIDALAAYDSGGDYGVFAPLLGDSGKYLRQAAYREHIGNPESARKAIGKWREAPSQHDDGCEIATLFQPELEQRLAWSLKDDRAAWEADLARAYLQKGDYLHAAIYGIESRITRHCLGRNESTDQRGVRENSRKRLLKEDRNYRALNNIRNALAHGVREPDRETSKKLESEEALGMALRKLIS